MPDQREPSPDERDLADRDPEEVLRRMLAISAEDAEKVREDAAAAVKPEERGRDKRRPAYDGGPTEAE
jgi:hypothetical protein